MSEPGAWAPVLWTQWISCFCNNYYWGNEQVDQSDDNLRSSYLIQRCNPGVDKFVRLYFGIQIVNQYTHTKDIWKEVKLIDLSSLFPLFTKPQSPSLPSRGAKWGTWSLLGESEPVEKLGSTPFGHCRMNRAPFSYPQPRLLSAKNLLSSRKCLWWGPCKWIQQSVALSSYEYQDLGIGIVAVKSGKAIPKLNHT